MSLFLFMGSNTADANGRYIVALACHWNLVFTVRYDPLTWTASCPVLPPNEIDAGGNDAAGGAEEDNECLGPSFSQEDEAVGQAPISDSDIQVSGGSGFLYS